MNKPGNDRIEKRTELRASQERVWRALTDYREFGEWFRVILDVVCMVNDFQVLPGNGWAES